jgi:hypothetical protein
MGGTCSTHGGMRILCDILVEFPKGKRSLGRQGADGRAILKLISRKSGRRGWTGLICLRIGTDSGLL